MILLNLYLRTDAEILKKFRYVEDYNARSANKELKALIKKHIADFEKEHGKITFDQYFSLPFVYQFLHFIKPRFVSDNFKFVQNHSSKSRTSGARNSNNLYK